MDVLSASALDDTIAWYENTDGQGSFGAQQIISTDADEAISVYTSDIENDGDIDVLFASRDDKIAWYENTDGLGNFSSQKIITTNADGAKYVFAVIMVTIVTFFLPQLLIIKLLGMRILMVRVILALNKSFQQQLNLLNSYIRLI